MMGAGSLSVARFWLLGALLLIVFATLVFWPQARADETRIGDGFRELDSGNFEVAVNAFQQALNEDPENLKAHEGLAWAFYGLADFQSAAAEADRRLALAPEDRSWHSAWAVIVRDAGRQFEMLATVRAWAEEAPKDGDAQLLLGRMLRDAGELATARDVLRAVLAASPANVEALRALADVDNFLQLHSERRDLLSRAAAILPADAELQREFEAADREVRALRIASLQPTLPLSLAVIILAIVVGQIPAITRTYRYILAGTSGLVVIAFAWIYAVQLT